MIRPLSPSRSRPANPIDQSILRDNKKTLEAINRRGIFRGAMSLGALTMLTGCDVTNGDAVQGALRAISSWNDRAQDFLFDPKRLAPTYSEKDIVRPPRFNAFYDATEVKPVDRASWRLELGGMIANKAPWTVDQIAALPAQSLIIQHICVEGWSYIGQWSGPNFGDFLRRVGADLTAKYVAFRCADGYTSSIDMASALHPQTILATRYSGDDITDPFGAPLRLRTSIKLGFKNPKWITAIEVTDNYPGGYWEDRGYNWYSGL